MNKEDIQERCFGFWLLTSRAQAGRVLGYTKRGDIAVLPNDTRSGDIVAAFPGASLLFVIRPCENNESELVGPCYAHGHMDGLILYALKVMTGDWSQHVRTITLR